MTWYTEKACESVDKFIRELDDTRDAYGSDERVYRGHACSCWELRPTLYRERYGGTAIEITLVDNFMLMCHRNGVYIPSDAMSYSTLSGRKAGFSPTVMQTSDGRVKYDIANIAFAMARHARIPTRHLDFTWDPLVASYFAVTGVVDFLQGGREPPKRIAVWAINYNLLVRSFGVIHHDWTNIPSLRNQKGLFVFDPTINVGSLSCWTDAPSFDVALSEIGESQMSKKITLKFTPSNLLDLSDALARRGITTCSMFPTYENVRDATMRIFEEADST